VVVALAAAVADVLVAAVKAVPATLARSTVVNRSLRYER
jgi:hypothetical protein